MPRLLLVDGNSIMNRAFYGLSGNNMLKTRSGIYTNAVYGFLNILQKYLGGNAIEYFAVAFDRKEPTFRHEMYKEYKATRTGMPDELASQMPIIKELIDALGVTAVELPGAEADDIIGTIAKNASGQGFQVLVLSGDKDLFQLIDDNTKIEYPSSRSGLTSTAEYNKETLYERYGIVPSQIPDLKALMGDSSDNIPGVKGIGEKGALKLIREFGSIDSIYENIESAGSARIIELLKENREMCFMSRELSRIKTDLVLNITIEETRKRTVDEARLLGIFEMLEFRTQIEKFGLKKKNNGTKTEITKAAKVIGEQELVSVLKSIEEPVELYLSFDSKKRKGRYILESITFILGDSDIYALDSDKLPVCLMTTEKIIDITVYDAKVLFSQSTQAGIEIKKNVFDVTLASYLLNPDEKTDSADIICRKYLDMDTETFEDSRISLFDDALPQNPTRRCVFAGSLVRLRKILEDDLKEKELLDLYYSIELPVAGVLAEMEFLGIRVDDGVLRELDSKLVELLYELDVKIKQIAGTEFNLNSPKQLGEILFERLRLPVLKKTRTGYSTSAEVLEMLRGRHEIIKYILDYRQYEKLRSTYSAGLLSQISDDGRIYSTFNQKVAATGRLSSQDPNLQNIPIKLEQGREFRKAFIADEGNVLIDADYSQIELRVLAHVSKDSLMKEVYEKGEDIHSQTAAYIFNEDNLDRITPEMRNSAKTVNFSVIYGISAYSLAIDLGITRSEAQRYIDDYFRKYTGVKKYLDGVIEEARTNGYVKTLFGRIRYVNEIKSSNFNTRGFWERVAMNTPIQGTAADIIKLAMIKVSAALKDRGYKAKMILQVHDELLIDCPVNEKEDVMKIICDSMQNACILNVPLKVDIKDGKNWFETKC